MEHVSEKSNNELLATVGFNKSNLKKLGIETFTKEKFSTIKQISDIDPGMVLGQIRESVSIDDNSKKISFKKGDVFVVPLSMFDLKYKQRASDKNDKGIKIFKPYRQQFKEYFNRYKGQDLNGKKILIWRTGGLGDIIVIQSVLKAIKDKFPESYIIFGTSPNIKDIFNCFPKNLADEIHDVPFKLDLLKKCHYHMNFMSAIENCIESQKYNYFDVFQKMSCLDYNSDLYLSELRSNKVLMKQLRIPKKTVLIHMAASTRLRSIDPIKWANIINILIDRGYSVGIIDSFENRVEVDKFINVFVKPKNPFKVFNFANVSNSLMKAVAIADSCIGTISIDSSFTHITAALNKPGITICGPYPSYNVVGKYKTVDGIDSKGVWNDCGKNACYLNSQEAQCPFLLAGKFPGCTGTINDEFIVNKFISKYEEFKTQNLEPVLLEV